jgi:hypothetical protein
MVKKIRFISLTLFFALTFAVSGSFACSCAARPTVLSSFDSSKFVITAHVTTIEKADSGEEGYSVNGVRSATMVVDKVYKGNLKVGESLKFAQGGGGDCVWTYDDDSIGKEFLLYLGPPTKGHPFFALENIESDEEEMFHAFACGRSGGVEGAIDDLAYLNNINKVRGKTRLSGQFQAWSADEPIGAGMKLKIKGKNKSFETKADKNGFFEIYDLPPGDYRVIPEVPFGWKVNNYMLDRISTGYGPLGLTGATARTQGIPVRIEEKKHAALDLYFDIDTAIKGRILSTVGKPMKNVCVKAVSTDLKDDKYLGPSDCTNEKGEFVIEEMEAGTYFLVVNDDGKLDEDEPFGTIFYPGVSELKDAGVVSVERGKYATGRDIQIPHSIELVTFRGKLVFSDGKPVSDEWVKFIPDDEKRFDGMRQKTDTTGSFVFRLPKGSAGTISGEMSTYSGEFKDCQKLETIITESGKRHLTVESTTAKLNSLEPFSNAELRLPFPYCEKAKE